MVDIQDTSLNYHLLLHYMLLYYYMCIVQFLKQHAQTTTFSWFHFEANELSSTLVGLFFQWKKLTNKTCQTIYFTYQKSPCECFIKRAINVPDQQVLIFLSMILLLKKLFQKIFYLAFTNTCANKDFLKNHVAFEVSIKGNQWACKSPE